MIHPSTATPAAGGPPRPGPARRGAVLAAVFTATAALTAGTTYALTRPPTTGTTPAGLSADQTQAREHLCEVFDTATRNQEGRGGVVDAGKLNVPVVLRIVNRSVALQNALTPAVPDDIATATRTYITRSLDLSNAATAGEPITVLKALTAAGNNSWEILAGLCGVA